MTVLICAEFSCLQWFFAAVLVDLTVYISVCIFHCVCASCVCPSLFVDACLKQLRSGKRWKIKFGGTD